MIRRSRDLDASSSSLPRNLISFSPFSPYTRRSGFDRRGNYDAVNFNAFFGRGPVLLKDSSVPQDAGRYSLGPPSAVRRHNGTGKRYSHGKGIKSTFMVWTLYTYRYRAPVYRLSRERCSLLSVQLSYLSFAAVKFGLALTKRYP